MRVPQGISHRHKLAWAAGAAALMLLVLTTGLVSARTFMLTPAEAQSDAGMTHEQMHEMMDAMHGEGASERMHQATGEDAEQMMDQCVAMMNMMGGMRGMMGEGAMPVMMGEPDRASMSDTMRRMMGR